MTASDSAVFTPYGWKKNFTICKSAAQGSTAKILTAKTLSVEFGERYYMLVFGLVFVLGTTSKPDLFVWRHQTLGRLWIRGFQVWTNPGNDAPATSCSGKGIPRKWKMQKWLQATAQFSHRMDEKRISPSASQLLRGVLQRSWLQKRFQLNLVKDTTCLSLALSLYWAQRQSLTFLSGGTRLWGGFELEDSKFEPTLSMMLLLRPAVEGKFRLIHGRMQKWLQATS